MLFPEPEKRADSGFLSTSEVEMSLRENDQVLVMFSSLRVESDVGASCMPVVCKFLDIFLWMFVTCRRSEKLSSPWI